jgi:DNA-directed RNA polymerase subunit RPC12/RpoP
MATAEEIAYGTLFAHLIGEAAKEMHGLDYVISSLADLPPNSGFGLVTEKLRAAITAAQKRPVGGYEEMVRQLKGPMPELETSFTIGGGAEDSEFRCPDCGTTLNVEPIPKTQSVWCPTCQERVHIIWTDLPGDPT